MDKRLILKSIASMLRDIDISAATKGRGVGRLLYGYAPAEPYLDIPGLGLTIKIRDHIAIVFPTYSRNRYRPCTITHKLELSDPEFKKKLQVITRV